MWETLLPVKKSYSQVELHTQKFQMMKLPHSDNNLCVSHAFDEIKRGLQNYDYTYLYIYNFQIMYRTRIIKISKYNKNIKIFHSKT